MVRKIISLAFAFALFTNAIAQRTDITSWKLQEDPKVSKTGEEISVAAYTPTSWYEAVVPGTVLQTLEARGIHKDIYLGKNILKIEDIANTKKKWWYRSTFKVPENYKDKKVWLCIDGINWLADFYVNGTKIGNIRGAFKRAKFDITSIAKIGEDNFLAVQITPPNNPGPYHEKTLSKCGQNGGPLGEDNPTFHASVGWDWIPTIPDRNIGIWQEVYLEATGNLQVRFPYMKTDLPLPSVSTADLTFNCQVINATKESITGKLKGVITPGDISFTKDISVKASETLSVTITPSDVAAFKLQNPKLWWPNGYGDPHLYSCKVEVEDGSGKVSDTANFRFGVREVGRTNIGENMLMHINGQQILVRGGSWGMDEAMKKFDVEVFKAKVRFHKDANLNMIRNWIGMTDDEILYTLCDELGIMVWDETWLAHQADGPLPKDSEMWLDNAKDKVLRYRSHACIVIWCCRNESNPPDNLNRGLKAIIDAYDKDTRIYLETSGAGGVHSGGPWHIVDLETYTTRCTGFHDEIGIPSIPNLETMKLMNLTFPKNEDWAFHDYCGNGAVDPTKWELEVSKYGTPNTLEDFVRISQLVNFTGHRALFESAAYNFPNTTQGTILWMTNPSWPSLVWQLYDYWLDLPATFFGIKSACEPLHVQLDLKTLAVKVWNGTLSDQNLNVEAYIYDASAAQKWSKTQAVSAKSKAINNVFNLTVSSAPDVYFVKLLLKNGDGKVLSRNFYWMRKGTTYGNTFTDLASNKKQTVTADATGTVDNDSTRITIKVKQTGITAPAIMIRVKVLGKTSGKRILPAYYDNNYFSLLPDETQDVTISFATKYMKALGDDLPKIEIEGWNVIGTVTEKYNSIPVISHVVKNNNGILLNGNNLQFSTVNGAKYSLKVFDFAGKQIQVIDGASTGKVNITLNKINNGTGARIYVLYVNGTITAKFKSLNVQ
jgi:hypothetical protein